MKPTHSHEFQVSSVPPFGWLWVSFWTYHDSGCIVFQARIITKRSLGCTDPEVWFDERFVMNVHAVRTLAKFLCKISGLHEPNFDVKTWRKMTDEDKAA